MSITKKVLVGAAVAAAFVGGPAVMAFHDAEHYTLDGNASYITPGNASARAVHLVSDATAPNYSAIDYGVEADTTFADLTTLSSDFRVEADDTCVGGSPRFQVALEDATSGDTGNMFIYFGTDSGGAACIPGTWQNSGDFLEAGRLVDTSQLDGGTFYDTYAAALAKYAGYEVTGISVVTDSSWAAADGEHAVDIDNTLINSTLFTYEEPVVVTPTPENKDECKKGGWQTLARADGTTFKNQGDCIQYVNTGK